MVTSSNSFIWENGEYPLSAFYFTVDVGGGNSIDTSFQEVSGIGPELETEDLVEGGENNFVHHLPTTMKHPNLVLKRGIAKLESPLVTWCRDVLEGGLIKRIKPVLIHVSLLNEEANPIRKWSFANAYPVHWEFDSFNSTNGEVSIETIEMSYTFSRREI